MVFTFILAISSFAMVSGTPGSLRGWVSNFTLQAPWLGGLNGTPRPRDFWNMSDDLLTISWASTDRCSSDSLPQDSKCSGCPPMKDGKLCASTTFYTDTTKGACGCGESEHVDDDYWTLTEYTAAMNCVSLDPDDPLAGWCPLNCEDCFELCSTGGITQGTPTTAGTCRVFKVTNRCGDGYDTNHPNWCSQQMSYEHCASNPSQCRQMGNTNHFGYPAHFDLQDFHRQITDGLGWDNVEVTFEKVS
eukprot:CAMPEP_0197649552 /NCGR_PEP_ID=MMETSP1338-20131121/28824_1 /TAXON_ID=43686 ORGANISM="Pelagodinium beii, Strain RCC1491" /NCGR_SAMPLE_ID=MMETSP1338 /ASSEMBLY_ACC=CAM_ASM_000754 /LENGTH=245 /DNA_ID=CAMNT_0043223777 /DNA_START=58 /DNA_END=791 /DNA_ORIENTATION=+